MTNNEAQTNETIDREHAEAVRRQHTLTRMTLAQRARFEAAMAGVIITR